MIKLFDMHNGELQPTIHCTAILFLKEIMDVFPEHYMLVYKYLFYMTCPDEELNPYTNTPEQDRSEIIARHLNIGEGFYLDDMKIEKAVMECRMLYSTPAVEVYRAAKKLLEKLQKSFHDEELTWGGKDATGPGLVAAIEKLPKLIKACNDAEKEMKMSLKSRGGQNMAYDIEEHDED